jgi:hypothetical protein
MMTCSVQGCAEQLALAGMRTWKFCEPLCCVFTPDPAGKPSAMTGCVGDQTGLVMIVGLQVPCAWSGSGIEVSV